MLNFAVRIEGAEFPITVSTRELPEKNKLHKMFGGIFSCWHDFINVFLGDRLVPF